MRVVYDGNYRAHLMGLARECLELKIACRGDAGLLDAYEECIHSLYMFLPPSAKEELREEVGSIEEVLDEAARRASAILADEGKPLHVRLQEAFNARKPIYDCILEAILKVVHEAGITLARAEREAKE